MAEPVLISKHSDEWIRLKIQSEWKIVVRQVPPRPTYSQQSTCAHVHCKYAGRAFETFSFCVSLESHEQWKKRRLVLEPPVDVQDPKMEATAASRFLYHLTCLEDIFEVDEQVEHVEHGLADKPAKNRIPLAEFADSIFAETRGYGSINSNYSLGYWLHYLLEKWIGICLYHNLVDQHGNFNEDRAISIYGDNLTIMDTGIYTSFLSIIRRNQVECSYHFRGLPELLEVDGNVKNMRLSKVLTLGEPWAWQIARIDELCLEYRNTYRLNGEATDLDGGMENSDTD